MIHGPCGHANLNSPCMKNGVCTKRFPKKFAQRTEANDDGYPVYRRRDDGRTLMKKNTILDNGFVVPYNRTLLSKYRAHINIELCNQGKSIKYLFKYVNKGHDRVTTTFFQPSSTDAASVGSPVIRLSFHLPDHQPLIFNENQSLKSVLERPTTKKIMFLAWFEANKKYPPARELRYGEFPQHYVYKEDSRVWVPRKQGFSIGRVTTVPPGKGEDFYLRLLLNIQRGCTSYEDIRTVSGNVYATFKDACYILGLLEDDKEYIGAIKEAYGWANGHFLRLLFAVMLISKSLSRPEYVWESCWSNLFDDITYKHERCHNNPNDSLKNYALIEIEKILQSDGKSLRNFDSMSVPLHSSNDTENRLVLDELDYDVVADG
ncbi:PREDICTED: uncharacterized protein LOC105948935 [Erythranthe guttata]|uniref:uncharacterized protein LOC105948935 n=1 Tax=Erythranthe guttata TaxID=4155 RepID=UPI00064DA090|nr:PREDICTED: uncharacterized protein LOC105948935 [Erythranthe guttata]|eukprot:XP_012827649.1 PREDICTED: uncharacterized protein LOC105948935 [Erythranthe guttata]